MSAEDGRRLRPAQMRPRNDNEPHAMAKRRRKRLNKPVLIILVVLAALAVLAAVPIGYGFWRYGSAFPGRMVNYFFPKDPAVYEQRGDEAYERGDYRAAAKAYRVAANESGTAALYYKLGRALVDLALKGEGLTDTERNEEYQDGLTWLRKSATVDPQYPPPQRLICDMLWRRVAHEMRRRRDDTAEPPAEQAATSLERYVEVATKLLKIDSDNHRTRFRRGLAEAELYYAVKAGHDEAARSDLQKAVELAPNETKYWLALVEFCVSVGDRDGAHEAMADAVRANPDCLELLVRRAEMLWRDGHKDRARRQLEQAIAANPDRADAYLSLAALQCRDGQLPQACETLRRAKEKAARDARVYQSLAGVYHRMGKLDDAAEELRAGLALPARSPAGDAPARPRKGDGDLRWRMTYALASIVLDKLLTDTTQRHALLGEARACLAALGRLEPDSAYHAKIAGRVAMAEGRLDEAIQLLKKAWARLRATSEHQTALLLASLYLRRSRPVEAEALVDEVLARPGQTHNVRFLLAKAQIRMKLRDHDGAADLVARVLQVDPSNAEARALDSTLKALAGKSAALPRELGNAPMIVRQLRDRAETLWFEDRRDEAVRLMEELHRRAGDDLSIVSQLVDLYLAQKQADEAEKLLKQAAARHPDNEALRFRLALLHEKDAAKRLAMRRRRAEKLEDPFRRALELADLARLEGKPAAYLKHLADAVRLRPTAAPLADLLLRRAVALQDWKVAEECVRLASKANADGQGGRLFAARLAAARGQYAVAIVTLDRILQRSPENVEARALLGECHLRNAHPDLAEKAFRRALKTDPANVQALIGMVRVTQDPSRRQEHADWVAKAYRHAPRDRYVRTRHLAVRARQADPHELGDLLAECDRLLRKTPPERRLPLQIIRADLLERNRQLEQAERQYRLIYEQFLRSAPSGNGGSGSAGLAGATLLVGFLVRTGQVGKADAVMADLLKRTPDRAGAYVLYGLALSTYSPEQAAAAFDKARQADPKDPRVYLATSQHYAAQGQWRRAADALKQYTDLRRADIARRKRLVLLRLQAGQTDLASRRLAEILRREPDDAGALTLQAFLLRKTGRDDEAERLFTRAAQADPTYPLPLILRGVLYLDRGEANRARADLSQAAKRPAGEPTIMLQMAVALRRLGDLTAAEAVLNDLLDSYPHYLPGVRERIGLLGAQQHWWKLEPELTAVRKRYPRDVSFALAEAEMWRRRGKAAKAVSAYTSAYRLAPQSAVVTQAYLQSLLDAQRYKQAAAAAEKSIDHKEIGPWARAVLARCLAAEGKDDPAANAFLEAVRAASANQVVAVARLMRAAYGPADAMKRATAWVEAHGGDWHVRACVGELGGLSGKPSGAAAAADALRRAVRLADTKASKLALRKRMAHVCAALGADAQAVQAYRDALRSWPDDLHALNNLAYLYTNAMARPQEALGYARRAFKLAPADANVLDTYGWTLAKLGRLEEARKRLAQAVLRGQATPTNHYHLGWVLEHLDKPELVGAQKQYMQGLAKMGDARDNNIYRLLTSAVERLKDKLSSASGR